ncbi:Endoribonuclease XendoU [Blastocladiella britannica]|nr:Endoribonuclease XendoU [Blastocladiella britannica]
MTHTPAAAASFADVVDELWRVDRNRLSHPKHYTLDIQQGKSMHQQGDVAHKPLFASVDKPAFMAIPTFAAFYALLDNYVDETGVAEHVSQDEARENRVFIDAVVETECSRVVLDHVNREGWWKGGKREWAAFLLDLWFSLYSRESRNDSSAFEHVFVGEIRNGQVIGFHNWITIFIAERKKVLDYQGYIWPRRRHASQPSNDGNLLKLQFLYKGKTKPLSTCMIGVSPEFELMLYTLAYLSGRDKLPCYIDESECEIVVHKMFKAGKSHIGSSYLDIHD